MLRIHFTPRDLTRTTVSAKPAPLWEVLLSLQMLQQQDGRLVFGDWRRHVRARVAPDQLRLLLELTPPKGYSPNVRTLAESSPDIGRAIRTYHDTAIAPYWKSIGTHVSADHAHRGEALARHGVERLLSTLHPRVRWADPVLQVLDMDDRDFYLDGSGIELQPSAFCWRVPIKLDDPGLKPILVYPINHAPGMLRQAPAEPNDHGDALGALLGSTRAAALEAAVNGCSTNELARLCKVSAGAASQQAHILREAGLITTRRVGATVRHEVTQLGILLLAGHRADHQD
ncbi:winged helix-turn-helix domain-containing protein [Kribbella yunnanensis]|uniref:Winged helix-turn-helix domain-containing protein n=1 Tax=Kribbella yunnanensis TaxID=190194 RepID=A0ABP4V825_9ACTN